MRHEPLTFVHAADLHLDSPFKGITEESDHVASTLRQATFRAFTALVDLCFEVQADFLLVAGDVYDGCDRSLYAQLAFRDGLAHLDRAGIASYVVHGNHDPLSGWASHLAWPARAHVFDERLSTTPFERHGCTVAEIAGISHAQPCEKRNLAQLFPRGKSSGRPFRVGLVHCNVGGTTGHDDYAPCSLDDLQGADVDYWALGHVHQHRVLAQHPHVVYPGNTQGRSIRETSARGCCVVRVEADGVAAVEFRPLDAVRWDLATVSIDGITSLDALDTRIAGCLEEMRVRAGSRPVVARLEIRGRGPMHAELRRDGMLADLRRRYRETRGGHEPFLWLERLDCASAEELDFELLGRRQDLVGTVVRVAQELESDPGRIACVLEDLYVRRNRLVEAPTEEELQAILADARLLCIDLLEGRS